MPSEENSSESLIASKDAGVIPKYDLMADYMYRGTFLDDHSLLDFILNTYEQAKSHASTTESSSTAGRKPNKRVDYLPERNKPDISRVVRTAGHETLPRFVGPWFPRSDREEKKELHAAAMLMLLRPWRSLSDIKANHTSFSESLASFKSSEPAISTRVDGILANIQYYYDCADDADDANLDEEDPEEQPMDDTPVPDVPEREVTDDDIEVALMGATPERSRVFALHALNTARDMGIFSTKLSTVSTNTLSGSGIRGSMTDVSNAKEWERILKHATKSHAGNLDMHASPDNASQTKPSVLAMQDVNADDREPSVILLDTPSPQGPLKTRDMLFEDQRRAYDMIEEHLIGHLEGQLWLLALLETVCKLIQ